MLTTAQLHPRRCLTSLSTGALRRYREAAAVAFIDCVKQICDSKPEFFAVEVLDPKKRALEVQPGSQESLFPSFKEEGQLLTFFFLNFNFASQEMVRVEVPGFADALASLISEIDEDGTRQCLDLLALPPTHLHQPTLAASLCEKVST